MHLDFDDLTIHVFALPIIILTYAGELPLDELLEKYNLHQQSVTPECEDGELSEEHEG